MTDSEAIRSRLPNAREIDLFKAESGWGWKVWIDERRGRPCLLDGGAIPFIPGSASHLTLNGCDNASCVPVDHVEKLAREFLARHQGLLGVTPGELALDPNGSGPVWNSLYFLRFQWVVGGIPVEGASVFFRINNGNLIQVATERIAQMRLDPSPSLTPGTAWQILNGYLGGYAPESAQIQDRGTLRIIPVTSAGMAPDAFRPEEFGGGIAYKLVYRLSFQREGEMSTWEALIDAHTGEILRFEDSTRYGRIHGGVRPSDGLPPEEDRPFPYADIGGGLYADGAGRFSGGSATTTLTGKYAQIVDSCGSISASTSTGDLSFGQGPADVNLTDCNTPSGNACGPGNTKPSRTLYYNTTALNLKAQVYAPTNTWLANNPVTIVVNDSPMCNAGSSGQYLYFFTRVAGSCNNLGEIPGVALHEWAHSYDEQDGSGGSTPSLEAYADITATLQTHNSCVGAGFYLPGNNCTGFGDPCTDCTGMRDIDYAKHQKNTPWTYANQGSIWTCAGGSGPCGLEDHCESGLSAQGIWDLATRDLVGAPMAPNPMDAPSAWMLAERLWFSGVRNLTANYTCTGSPKVTSGCGPGTLYTVMRAIDDDGDGTASGTPHAAAIFAALDRHGIACGVAGDAANQNQRSASCPAMDVTALSAVAGSEQVTLNWSAVTGATRYFVFRNEGGCGVAFTRIAVVSAPVTTYIDTGVVNGVTYYYRFQSATANDSCTSSASSCVSVIPQTASCNLHHQFHSIVDLCHGSGAGSGDATVDVGEDVTLPVTLANLGTLAGTGVTSVLSTTTPGIAVRNATAVFPDIDPLGAGVSLAPHFVFSVGPSVACGTQINFSIQTTANEGSWSDSFSVPVRPGTGTLLNEGFEGGVLPSGWTTQVISGNAWSVTPFVVCAGTKSLRYSYMVTQDADSWVYTPNLAMLAGSAYTLSFKERVGGASYPEKLSVYIGASPDRTAMTSLLWQDLNMTNVTCQVRAPSFTVPADGTYYIGFHATSLMNQYAIGLDDISVQGACSVNTCTAAAPGETASSDASALRWVDGSQDSILWGTNAPASGYRLYRGGPPDLAGLTSAANDSCLRWAGAGTQVQGALTETPASDSFFWYLVTAVNAAGEGPAGTGASGPRILDSTGDCP